MSSKGQVDAPRLWLVLSRCHRALSQAAERSIRDAGLCLTDFAALEALLHKGPLTITEIQGKVLLASGSMTAAVDRLEQKGLIKRGPAPSDRRAKVLHLTPEGRRVAEAAFRRHAAELESAMTVLNPSEKRRLHALLKKLGLFAAGAVAEAGRAEGDFEMIQVRRSVERGHANHGWLDTYHTFSFADYYDPKFMGFRSLRVINEDRVAPGAGFGRHGHRDMEILTYVLEGSLAHKDSMGHQQALGPNEIQRMSAGTGVMHSEFNPSKSEPLHFFQIWIEPATNGTKPSYEQIRFDPREKQNKLKRLAGPTNGDGAARINQDAHVFVAELVKGTEIAYRLGPKRAAWVHVVRGEVGVNGVALRTGDAAAVTGEEHLALSGGNAESSEILLFDLA